MADMRQVLSILLQAKDETRGATASAASNFTSLSQKITAAATGFLAIRQAAQDAFGVIDTLVGSVVRDSAEFDAFSRRIGISAEALSELKYAGEVANVPLNQLTMGAQRLTRRLGEIAKFGRGEAKPALEALGISIENIIDLRADEQLELILEALGGVANESERAALAMKFFDSEGVALVQLAGRTKELREEARRLGVSFDQDMIDRAVAARENMLRLKGAVEGVRNAVANEILLAVDQEDLDRAVEAAGRLAELAGKTISFAIDVAGSEDFWRAADLLTKGGIFNALVNLAVETDTETLEDIIADLRREMERTGTLGIDLPVKVDGGRIQDEIAAVASAIEEMRLEVSTEGLDAIAQRLADLTAKISVGIEDEEARASMDAIRQQLEQLRSLGGVSLDVRVDDGGSVDRVAGALANMEERGDAAAAAAAAAGESGAQAMAQFDAGITAVIAEMGTTEEALNRAVALAVQLGVPFEQIPAELRNVKAELDTVFVASGIVRAEWETIASTATELGHTQASLTRQLAEMLEAGVPIEEAWGRILERIGYTGEALTAIIDKMPQLVGHTVEAEKAFNVFNTSMEEAAERLNRSMKEQAGSLGVTLTDMIGTTADRMNSIWFTAVVQGYEFKETMTRIFRQLVADILAELAKLAAKKVFFDLLNLAAGFVFGGPAGAAAAAGARVVNPGGGPGGNLGTIQAPRQGVLEDEILGALRGASIEAGEATLGEEGVSALVRAVRSQPVRSEVILPEDPFRSQASALDRVSAAVEAMMGAAAPKGLGIIQPATSPTTELLDDEGSGSELVRNVTFNITVNTGFGSRGAGLETARALVPFLREVGI